MSRPELVVPVADLDRGAKHVEFALSPAWLGRALEGSGATIVGPATLDVTLSKNGNEVLVRGNLVADLTLPCVVTLDPVPVPVRTEILLMLSPKSGTAERAASQGAHGPGPKRARAANKDPGEKVGKAKPGKWEETPILTEEDAGKDTYEGHEVALDSFVREFLLLELPMFPRRSDLPIDQTAANPPLPAASQPGSPERLDPRLAPLAELKSRLEKIKKE